MVLIELRNKLLIIPEKGNELSQKQLVEIADALFIKKYDQYQLPLKLLKIISGLSWWNWLRLAAEDVEDFIYLAQFILSKEFSVTKQLLTEYKGFYGPTDELKNMRMDEFVYSEHYFSSINFETKDFTALDDFISIIYRPPKSGYDKVKNLDGDIRIPFNEEESKYQKRKIARWPLAVKLAIAIWYGCCRNQLVAVYPDVFSGGDGEGALYGLQSIMRSIAKEGTYGTFEQVEKAYLHLMIMELNETVHEARRMEAEMKKQSK